MANLPAKTPNRKYSLQRMPIDMQLSITDLLPSRLDKLSLQQACAHTEAFRYIPPLGPTEMGVREKQAAASSPRPSSPTR